MVDDSRLSRWLLLSVLLHALLVPLFAMLRQTQIHIEPPKFVDIDLSAPLPKPAARPAAAPPPAPAVAPPAALPLPQSQIVTPPDAGEEKPPPDTRLLSDRDNLVAEEKVKRAPAPSAEEVPKREDAPEDARPKAVAESKPAERREAPRQAPPPRQSRQAARPERVRQEERIAALPRIDQLLPGGGDFAAIAKQAAQAPAPSDDQRAIERRRLMLGGDSPALAMRPGVSDFLPGVKEGSITLLNTKAERFAPFVRRVAGRVFQHLDIRLRQTVRSGVVSGGHEYAVVEAIMSKQGKLVSARVIERQSNSSLAADRILLSVTEPDTFFDANPPAGAEGNDGNIHFILMIDLQVQTATDPRTGRVVAGYQGVAGVGLDAAPGRRSSDG